MKFLAWMFLLSQLSRLLLASFPELDLTTNLDPNVRRTLTFVSSLFWVILSIIIIF